MAVLEEVISDTLGFKLGTSESGIKIFSDPIALESVADKYLSLLAVGSVRGLVALSNTEVIRIGRTSQLLDENATPTLQTVEGKGTIRQIQMNANETKLWLVENDTLGYVTLDDTLTDLKSESTALSDIMCIEAHPRNALKLAYITTNGTLHIMNSLNSTVEVSSGVRCFAWATDGGSLVAMKDANEIEVFGENGDNSGTIPVDIAVASQLELSTDGLIPSAINGLFKDTWLVAYDKEDASPDDHEIVTFIVSQKEGKASTAVGEILLPGFDAKRRTTYYSHQISNWSKAFPNLTLATSSLATEVAVINCGAQLEFITPDEDVYRTTFPMNESNDEDTCAVGFAIDLTATGHTVVQPWSGIDEAVGVLPIVWVLLDTGHLAGWFLVDKQGIKDSELSLSRALGNSSDITVTADNEPAKEIKEEDESKKVENPFASSKETENPFAPSKESPFGTISTNDNPFAKASPFGLGDTAAKDSKPTESGFGKGGFGSSITTPSLGNAGFSSGNSASGFGSSGFGNSGGSSGFGSSGFGAPTTTSAFGSSGFGTSSSSAFGSSGFGGLGTQANSTAPAKPTTFGQPGLVGSAFGQSSFATKSSSEQKSKDQGGAVHSGFGKFGNLTPSIPAKDSVFGSVAASTKPDSPFASLGENKKSDSPFGSLADPAKKDSPFAALGNAKKTESPFAALGETKKTSLPFGSVADSAKKESPLSGFGSKNAELDKESSSDGQESSAEEIEATPDVSDKEQTTNDLASFMTMDSLSNEADFLEKEISNGNFGSLSLSSNKPFPPRNQFSVSNPTQNLSTFSVSLVKSGDFDNMHPKMGLGLLGGEQRKPGYIESVNETEASESSESLSEEEDSASVVDSDQGTFDELGESYVEVDDVSEVSEDGVGIPIDNQYEVIRFRKPHPPVTYSYYDGPTTNVPSKNNAIHDKMVEIYNDTEGELKVLKKNTKAFEKFAQSHLAEDADFEQEWMEKSENWRLAWTPLLEEVIVSEARSDVAECLPELESQYNVAEELVKGARQLKDGMDEIHQMLQYITKMENETNSAAFKKRELDTATLKLQRSLRSKLADVEAKQDSLLSLMMPLKVKYTEPQKMISNLKKTLLHLQQRVLKCEESMAELDAENSSNDVPSPQKLLTGSVPVEDKTLSKRLQINYGMSNPTQVSPKPAVFE